MNVLVDELNPPLSDPPALLPPQCQRLVSQLYGGLVPAQDAAKACLLHQAQVPHLQNAWLASWRIEVGHPVWACWTLYLLRPDSTQAVPVLACGDACWNTITTEVLQQFASAGVALAWFNRVELASDTAARTREGPVFARFPGQRFGALSVWAWAYSRVVDALLQMPALDPTRIGIAGHSRGGKAALLCGATDPRIWLTAANNSGAGGSGSSVVQGPGSETLPDLAQKFPHWLARDVQTALANRQTDGLDQDMLLSAIAPRKLLVTQAVGDLWANPLGTQHVAGKVAAHYAHMQAPGAFELVCREGGHAMVMDDWAAVLGQF